MNLVIVCLVTKTIKGNKKFVTCIYRMSHFNTLQSLSIIAQSHFGKHKPSDMLFASHCSYRTNTNKKKFKTFAT